MKTPVHNQQGFTLLEVLIAMAVASILGAAMYTFQQNQIRTNVTQEMLSNMHQNARAAMHFMVHDIRMAGCLPDGLSEDEPSSPIGIIEADADSLQMIMDIAGGGSTNIMGYNIEAGDNEINSPGEAVSYELNNGNIQKTDLITNQVFTIAENFDALNFIYYDEDDDFIPYAELNNSLDDIYSVHITVVARSGDILPAFMRRQNDVSDDYRNERGTLLYQADDNFRRVLLDTRVRLRNKEQRGS